ncbi:MAG: hypothetical protein Q9M29_08955, partial [Mariprofundaceae bacterium]|nr:hypothetical protein [Mariprofundaceae bacterium]
MDGMIASWDGAEICFSRVSGDAGGGMMRLKGAADSPLFPDIDPQAVEMPVAALLWPLEHLLVRPFSLPLEHSGLLDADILGQEMAEQTGEEADQWWLAWQSSVVEGGVDGLLYALPAEVKGRIGAHALWRDAAFIGVDACVRLGIRLPDDCPGTCAVLDADASGLFLGVWRQGTWAGL